LLDHEKPRLWQGVHDPYLYQLIVEVWHNGELLDSRTIPTSLRYFEFCLNKEFILNGKKLSLKGVSRHQDRQDVGWALRPEHQEKDMAIIQEMGANSI
jgi:beta-galactosidase